ncbi:MAG: hypothetical protein OXC37_03880, partial [Bdellovibrionaceae bacterium]|nr:hypothetical protein [Pseudobdellovibrionaceae bacterium]
DLFPTKSELRSDPNKASKFFTIENDAYTLNNLDASTRASHICNSGKCQLNIYYMTSSIRDESLTSMPSGVGSGVCGSGFLNTLPASPADPGFGSCNCEKYRIYAISKLRGRGKITTYLYANEKGLICASQEGSPGTKF